MTDPPIQVRLVPGEGSDVPQAWYFTFGAAHEHADRFLVVRGATFEEAREVMIRWFGTRWAFQYDEAAWHKHGVSQAERYGLVELRPPP